VDEKATFWVKGEVTRFRPFFGDLWRFFSHLEDFVFLLGEMTVYR
jgi:hypothetical protein